MIGIRPALMALACAMPGLVLAADTPVAGGMLALRANPKTGSAKSLAIVLADPAIGTPMPDPRDGATLLISGSREAGQCAARIDLDPAGWKELRRNGARRGYRYRAPRPGSQGIRRVKIRPGRIVIRGRGAALPCGLTAETQQVPVSLELRASDQRYCAEFGGKVKRNEIGRFVARHADAPTACPPRRANVVLLFADDLGYNDLSVQGFNAIPTPHIDTLAGQGVRFTNAYVTAGTCSPSRAALLSGRYQQRFGYEFNTGSRRIAHTQGRGLDPSVDTIADVMRAAGYVTGMVGKWHLGTQDHFHPLERGFDELFGFVVGAHPYFPDTVGALDDWETLMRGRERVTEQAYLTDAFAREAVSFIERHRVHPFFLYVPFNAVHAPDEASDEYLERFAGVPDERRRTYYAMVSALDDAVGTILQAIEDQGLTDDTLVVFANDNGGVLWRGNNWPLRFGKFFLFEGGVRVPMIIRWPGVATAGRVHPDAVSMLDLFPTFLGAAGTPPPDGLALDGTDLRPYLRGDASGPTHEYLFWRSGPNRAVRHGNWKLIQAGDHVWLFDLATDAGESTNLADDHPEVVTDLLDALTGWEAELVPSAWPAAAFRTIIIDGVPYEIVV